MLGPLEVRTDVDSGEIVEVAGARLRALLIMLALHPGLLVTASQLIDGPWPEEMPAAAANALQALVYRLRRALPEAVIEFRPSRYQLKIDPRSTDIVRFEDLAAAGRAQLRDNPAAAGQTLHQALALWRGPALVEVAETDFGQAAIARLDELRLTVIEQRVDADLHTGNTASLVAELEGLVITHPMREPLAARLMRALNAAGRRGAAWRSTSRPGNAWSRARRGAVGRTGRPAPGHPPRRTARRARPEGPPARQSYPQPRQRQEHQPARRAHQLRRPRRRTPPGRRTPRRAPPDHPHRPRRRGQVPAGRRGGPGRTARHARRGVAGRAGPGHRPRRRHLRRPVRPRPARAGAGLLDPAARRCPRRPCPPTSELPAVRPGLQAHAPGPGQLRAPGGRGRRPGRPRAGACRRSASWPPAASP